MKTNEYEMKQQSLVSTGVRTPEISVLIWYSYVKPDLKLRVIPAVSTIRPTCALRTVVIIFSLKEYRGASVPILL